MSFLRILKTKNFLNLSYTVLISFETGLFLNEYTMLTEDPNQFFHRGREGI